jgi:1,4-alpha-glucan branching enzyme
MVEKGSKKGTMRFVCKPKGAPKQVALCGDFTGWKPVAMRKQKNGSFAVVVPLGPGTYEYKFVVDGDWQGDPESSCWAPNPYGTMNSVAQVG